MTSFRVQTTPVIRRFLFGCLLNSLGSGLTMPTLVVYLNQVHHVSLSMASLVLSWIAVWGVIISGPVGWLIDHIGPKPVITFGLTCACIGAVSWSAVGGIGSAFIIATVVSTANTSTWPAQSTMMARMVSEELRQRFFGWQFMTLNLGLGIGGLISSTIVRVSDPGSFTRLFVLDGCSYCVYLLIIISIPKSSYAAPVAQDEVTPARGSYREVFRDKPFIRMCLLGICFIICGYASLDAGLPSLLTLFGGLSVSHLGPIWAANTGMIVIIQIYILKRIEGRSRTRMLGLLGGLWSICWLLIAIGMNLPSVWTFVFTAVGVAIFAIGETIWSPVFPALVNELSPEHLRGRYAAVSSLVWVCASAVGPVISGVMLGQKLPFVWLAGLIIGPLIVGSLFIKLGKSLTPEQDGRAN